MTDRQGAYGRDIVARGRALAEQRLAHLTELFETGRWRRYHSEHDFLENIREAKQFVQVWREMAVRGESRAKTLSPELPAATGHNGILSEQVHTVQPKSVHIAIETSVPVSIAKVAGGPPPLDGAAIAQVKETPAKTPERDRGLSLGLDDLKDRYPLLRNAF